MPTCPRCAALGAALALLAVAGCDTNNPGDDLATVEGRYTVAELTFDPEATALDDVDVAASLDDTETVLRIYRNEDDGALFEVESDEGGFRRINLTTTVSRGRVSFEAVSERDVDDLAGLLLPADFTLEYEGDRPSTLEGSFARSNVDLEAYDATRYQGLRNTSGRVRVRFERL
jgi:hypothetical protein